MVLDEFEVLLHELDKTPRLVAGYREVICNSNGYIARLIIDNHIRVVAYSSTEAAAVLILGNKLKDETHWLPENKSLTYEDPDLI